MTLVLGHISALEYWLSPPGKPSARVASSAFELPSKAASASDVESLSALSPRTFSLPVHAMTGVTVKNERPGLIAHHLHSASTSARSFYRISDDLHVCSPELAFVQMANVLPLPDLIRLGYELCGAYSLSEQADGGFFKRRQFVSPRKLQAFVDNSAKIHGRKSALRALRHILPNSASPAETRLAMCLSLPCNLGGFGLPRPVLNHRLNLTRSGAGCCREEFRQMRPLLGKRQLGCRIRQRQGAHGFRQDLLGRSAKRSPRFREHDRHHHHAEAIQQPLPDDRDRKGTGEIARRTNPPALQGLPCQAADAQRSAIRKPRMGGTQASPTFALISICSNTANCNAMQRSHLDPRRDVVVASLPTAWWSHLGPWPGGRILIYDVTR